MAKLTRLRDVRRRKALTQQQLAERAGVDRVTIAWLEGGRDEPFPVTVRKVADALGVEPADLLAPDAGAATNGPASGAAGDVALDERITVVDAPNVYRLLRAAPDLVPLINEAADQLVKFIPDADLRLEYVVDPEYGEPEELYLGAWTSLGPLEGLAALNQFDNAWWLSNARRASGLLIVDVR